GGKGRPHCCRQLLAAAASAAAARSVVGGAGVLAVLAFSSSSLATRGGCLAMRRSVSLGLLVWGVVALVGTLRAPVIAITSSDCPLDLGWSNFTLVASACSNQNERGKCCRYINAIVAVSVARYASLTGTLGVPDALIESCRHSISETLQMNDVPYNAMLFCGLGTKILVNFLCEGRTTVLEMLQSLNFTNVAKNCKVPLSLESDCRRCVNSAIVYIHHLIGAQDNVTLSTCRDATFVTLANQERSMSAGDIANCFFSVQGLIVHPGQSPQPPTPVASLSPPLAKSPSQHVAAVVVKKSHNPYHLTLIPAVCIGITGMAMLLLVILILLIRRKSRELKGSETPADSRWDAFPPLSIRRCREGPPPMFQRFNYWETKKATNNFRLVIGDGGFGTLYKAEFSNGLVVAVKKINNVSEQGKDDFCREMELLGRLHHRHLVALKGFCIEKHERFLMYEYMEKGSLHDHLHSSGRTPLSWQRRIQIAIDVANALEYLHVYCDPPLCHGDINSSNILLDENFTAKVADFGLTHISRRGLIGFRAENADIRGSPGYMDPEYVVTQELTEKSDVYSYGVLLLELVTGRHAVQDNKNLVEWFQQLMTTDSSLPEFVDPQIKDSYDLEQLRVIAGIIEWCNQSEGKARPSIKQVLMMLYERLDPVHHSFVRAIEDDNESNYVGEAINKGMASRGEMIFHSGDARYLQSSSSTSRSYCSRNFLLGSGSPQSPPGISSL
ncbi:hypothetical protein Taro_022406, partial [Colocasia esculenta]|nr:hypothetical protein [Colocasia esculenta]